MSFCKNTIAPTQSSSLITGTLKDLEDEALREQLTSDFAVETQKAKDALVPLRLRRDTILEGTEKWLNDPANKDASGEDVRDIKDAMVGCVKDFSTSTGEKKFEAYKHAVDQVKKVANFKTQVTKAVADAEKARQKAAGKAGGVHTNAPVIRSKIEMEMLTLMTFLFSPTISAKPVPQKSLFTKTR